MNSVRRSGVWHKCVPTRPWCRASPGHRPRPCVGHGGTASHSALQPAAAKHTADAPLRATEEGCTSKMLYFGDSSLPDDHGTTNQALTGMNSGDQPEH